MAVRSQDIQQTTDLDDTDLARRAAEGDSSAFEELYRRHSGAAWGVAQAVAPNRHDAADAVSEAFTRMLSALAGGRLAADVPFRPYLLVTTRNVAIDQHRRSARSTTGAEPTIIDLPALTAGPSERAIEGAEASFVAEAFTGLPERWRTVLWLTEVEGMPAREVGARLGLTANSAAQLAHRARARLRERYVQAHLRHTPDPECERTVSQLGAYVTGGLTPRAVAGVDQHLAACAECRIRLAQLTDVGRGLRAIALPIPAALGGAALARYHATFPPAAAVSNGLAARLLAVPDRAMRSVSVTTGALLTAGVIAAGLMSQGGPSPVKGSRGGGNTSLGPAPTVRPLLSSPAVEVTPVAVEPALNPPSTGAAIALPAGPTTALTPSPSAVSTSPTVPVGTPSASPHPAPTAPAGSGSSSAPALVQLAAGANLGALTISGAAGVPGGCTGVSVGGSSSCAPPPPRQPGVSITIATPVGKVGHAAATPIPKP